MYMYMYMAHTHTHTHTNTQVDALENRQPEVREVEVIKELPVDRYRNVFSYYRNVFSYYRNVFSYGV